MKKLFIGSVIAVGILGAIGLIVSVAYADDTADVTASVTVQYSAVSLSQSSFTYGSIAANIASSTLDLFSGAGIIATNDGSIADLDIYGYDTTGTGGGWTLGANTTGNNYMHEFCNDTQLDCALPSGDANYVKLTTSPQLLKANVDNNGEVAFQLRITTPTTPTDFSQQSAKVTVQASAN